MWLARLSTALAVTHFVASRGGSLRNDTALNTALLAATFAAVAINMVLVYRAGLGFLRRDRRTAATI